MKSWYEAHTTKYRVSIDTNGGGDSVGATGATCFSFLFVFVFIFVSDENRLDHAHACLRARERLKSTTQQQYSTPVYNSHLCLVFHFTTQ